MFVAIRSKDAEVSFAANEQCGAATTSNHNITIQRLDDIVFPDEMIIELDLGGKTPLSICRGCFDYGVEPPCSGGRRKNVRQAKNQAKQRKKKQRDVAVEASR
eukprot:scaffold11058_cov118-Skeletonema_dohrnii-CCMP3373.AAC.10